MSQSGEARYLFSHPLLRRIALVLIFLLVIGFHLMDLTDLPLDIDSTRQLPLVPLVAISLAPWAGVVTTHLLGSWKGGLWMHVAVIIALSFSLLAVTWDVSRTLRRVDYRPQADFWSDIGERLGHGTPVIGLTQDYGYRTAYWGWTNIQPWPSVNDQIYHVLLGGSEEKYSDLFTEHVAGVELFLIKDFKEIKNQPELASYLEDNYPVYANGGGYWIYGLRG